MSGGLRIAVDGLSGAGKGTLAAALASRLSLPYLDTGSLYRVLGVAALSSGTVLDDEDSLVNLVGSVNFSDKALLAECRNESVAAAASVIAAIPRVRDALVAVQRNFAVHGAVLDGRDIGTVIMPDADFKFYVKAGVEQRAKRRMSDLVKMGIDVVLEDVVRDLELRDKRDSSRAIAPLKMADDAFVVDTSFMNVDEVLAVVLGSIEFKC